jgi:hypothetical protein
MRSARLVVFLIAIIFQQANAVEDAQVCKRSLGFPTLKKVPVNIDPNYFIKVFGPIDLVAFGTAGQNVMMDIKTGEIINAPGFVDPVPLLDGRTLMAPVAMVYDPKTKLYKDSSQLGPTDTFPIYGIQRGEVKRSDGVKDGMTVSELNSKNIPYLIAGLSFYATSDILKKTEKVERLAFDPDIEPNYPSTGTLNRNGNKSTVRVLANGSGLLKIREYEVTANENGRDQVVPIGTSRTICKDTNFPGRSDLSFLSQPSLSKDGTEVATYDLLADKMRILKIGNDGKCKDVDILPFAAGKIDFSGDGRKILFHVDHMEKGPIQFSKPSDSQTLHSYLYDRDTKKVTPLNVDPNLDTYYPSFLGDGRILFFTRDKKSQNDKLSLHIIDPRQKDETSGEAGCIDGSCRETNAKVYNSMLALGKLYEKICEAVPSSAGTADGSLMIAVTLNPKDCREMVQKFWDKYRASVIKTKNYDEAKGFDPSTYRGLKTADLLAACPKEK